VIAQLRGRILEKHPNRIVVDVNGVGYDVFVPLSTFYGLGEPDAHVTLRIHTHVREDLIALYGFASAEEKVAFEKLISISGIGPTLAQKILSGIDAPDLADAVARGDTRKLSSIPGVGKKTAERICLELRDKLVLPTAAAAPAATARSSVDDDVHSALVNLGYRPKDAEAALDAARKELGSEAELSALLRRALKQLTK
jgi:Holliday junction DNA helicase RuvA